MIERWWFASLSLVALPATAQMVVGKNVQISSARPDNAHYESIAAADPADPRRLLAASHIYYEGDVQSSIVYASFDGGKTWQISLEPRSPVGAGVDPALAYGPKGRAYFATLGKYTLYSSPDGGKTWDKPAKIPELMGLDREYLVVDMDPNSRHHGTIYMNGTVFPPRLVPGSPGHSSGIGLYTSHDEGRTYGNPVFRLVFPPQSMGPMGNSVILSDGTVLNLLNVISDSARSKPSATERMLQSNATLYMTRSNDGGATLSEASFVSQYWFNPTRSQGATAPTLAVDPGSRDFKDRLYAVWSDFRSGRLEVMLSRSGDLGKTWSVPQVINDDRRPEYTVGGPDAILPTVAVNKDGVVLVVWYDMRESPDNLGWRVRARASLDGGETWQASEKVSEQLARFDGRERWSLTVDAEGESELNLQARHFNFYFSPGHTSGLVAGADGVFHPVWVDNRTGVAQLWTAPVTVAGTAARNGGGELAGLDDLGGKLSWEAVGEKQVRERGKDRLILKVRLKNVSEQTLSAKSVKLRLLAMQSQVGVPRALNADNGETGPGAVWDFSGTIPREGLAPGATGLEKDLAFALTELRPFRKDAGSNVNSVLSVSAKVLGN